MFSELDDPTPDLRPAQVLPLVEERGRRLRRRRRIGAAGGAGTVAALAVAAVLGLPSGATTTTELLPAGPAPQPPSAAPSAQALPVPLPPSPVLPDAGAQRPPAPSAEAPEAPAAPSPAGPAPRPKATPSSAATPSGAGTPAPPRQTPAPPAGLELRGDDLGVTRIGAPRAQAVAAVSALLGAPHGDPPDTWSCPAARYEILWEGFRLSFDAAGRVSGWASSSPAFSTPSGVRVGTTVARLQEVYGDRLRLDWNPDQADHYTVTGVAMLGGLTGPGPQDTVRGLSGGDCSGP